MESFLAKETGGGPADSPADSIVCCYLGNGEEKGRVADDASPVPPAQHAASLCTGRCVPRLAAHTSG